MTSLRVKALLILTFTLFQFSAIAEPQTADCGTTLEQVTDIVRSKFATAFPDPNYVYKLEGEWEGGTLVTANFSLRRGKPFTITVTKRPELFMICPQNDRTFYIYQKSDPSVRATARYNGKKLVVTAPFNSMAIMVKGMYTRISAPVNIE